MAPIRYSLHYEDYSEHLMSRFGKLLQMQSLVDMTLMCSSHTLRVHKAVLAASSAYFQEVLQKQTGEPLIILKMRFGVLKSLVEFMYCGKTQCLEENLDELVSAAQFLKIKGLSKVTKEGLGITNHGELPVFTPPVVISRPPQSLIDMHSQNMDDKSMGSQMAPVTSASQSVDNIGRTNKDMVVRIPFDIENGGASSGVDYPGAPRVMKPRRGRPSVRRAGNWEGAGPGVLGRAAERALLRREQDSRKAIHQLKHLQTRHMQDYMDRVTLSQAVNSICGPESSSTHNYMEIDNDLMYMDQTVSSNVLDPTISYTKEQIMGSETIPTSYSNTPTTKSTSESSTGISTAMSQYVNALKNAGLPTDLPILFESGDGSYINVNEQVLLDMVQSSEIQYEVIEQPNIIEKVANPNDFKSIDDLSKSIERGEMLISNNSYATNTRTYSKDSEYSHHEDAINSLNAILPDNLESFTEQQNYVVLDPNLQENNSMSNVNSHDFSCIDGDMQFFTKSMSDDVKKYYEEPQLVDVRSMEQLCPASTSLDTNFNISLLDTKISHLGDNMNQQYNSLNPDDLRRNDDCYDFGLQLPQSNDFLMSTPKRTDDETNTYSDSNQLDKTAQERDDIIKDLMNIENNINMTQNNNNIEDKTKCESRDFNVDVLNTTQVYNDEAKEDKEGEAVTNDSSEVTTSNNLPWDTTDISNKNGCKYDNVESGQLINTQDKVDSIIQNSEYENSVIDLTEPIDKNDQWSNDLNENNVLDKENEDPKEDNDVTNSTLENDIPYAVGLLPLKQIQQADDESFLKRKNSLDVDSLGNIDAKCLKRKVKYKKL